MASQRDVVIHGSVDAYYWEPIEFEWLPIMSMYEIIALTAGFSRKGCSTVVRLDSSDFGSSQLSFDFEQGEAR
jgi:hypothetical protein